MENEEKKMDGGGKWTKVVSSEKALKGGE